MVTVKIPNNYSDNYNSHHINVLNLYYVRIFCKKIWYPLNANQYIHYPENQINIKVCK